MGVVHICKTKCHSTYKPFGSNYTVYVQHYQLLTLQTEAGMNSIQTLQTFCTHLLAAEVPAVAVEEPPVVPVSAASPVASSVAIKVLAASSGAAELLTASSWPVEISTVLYFV